MFFSLLLLLNKSNHIIDILHKEAVHVIITSIDNNIRCPKQLTNVCSCIAHQHKWDKLYYDTYVMYFFHFFVTVYCATGLDIQLTHQEQNIGYVQSQRPPAFTLFTIAWCAFDSMLVSLRVHRVKFHTSGTRLRSRSLSKAMTFKVKLYIVYIIISCCSSIKLGF